MNELFNACKSGAKGGDKEAKFELSVMEKILPVLENGMIRSLDLDKDELHAIKSYKLLNFKANYVYC